MTPAESNQPTVGGSFVIEDAAPETVVTPEDFTGEQQMFAEATKEFIEAEILPNDEALEGLDYELTAKLLRKAGAQGLLGAEVPEPYGGLGIDKVSATIISEHFAKASSFALSAGAHLGIGTLPIVLFGTDEQKRKYLPALASGEKIAAYCLTEPGSGSDALGAKMTARLSVDGKTYVLNGSKMFITNGGFADVFVVYAKIDGTDFSAFIVERDSPGFTTGSEIKKMGIKGSSTVPLYFSDVHVPVEQLLGERGKGHLIAFNTLNVGRFKLGAACLGAAKEALDLSVQYANTRQQFGRPISAFPLIGRKLADVNIRTFALESLIYRTAGLLDGILQPIDPLAADAGIKTAKGIAEYALECSITKVVASETLSFAADEGVQIHGGYGFTQEYKIERIYRDARINRIFEGTNEINRLLIPGTLLKKAMRGELPLLQKAKQFQSELLTLAPPADFTEPLDRETHLLAMMKKMLLLVGGAAAERFGMQLEKEQEVVYSLADLIIFIFSAESVLLRSKKRLSIAGEEKAQHQMEMTQVYVQEAFEAAVSTAKEALAAIASGDVLRVQLSVLKKLSRYEPVNTISLKRSIAARVIAGERYIG